MREEAASLPVISAEGDFVKFVQIGMCGVQGASLCRMLELLQAWGVNLVLFYQKFDHTRKRNCCVD